MRVLLYGEEIPGEQMTYREPGFGHAVDPPRRDYEIEMTSPHCLRPGIRDKTPAMTNEPSLSTTGAGTEFADSYDRDVSWNTVIDGDPEQNLEVGRKGADSQKKLLIELGQIVFVR